MTPEDCWLAAGFAGAARGLAAVMTALTGDPPDPQFEAGAAWVGAVLAVAVLAVIHATN